MSLATGRAAFEEILAHTPELAAYADEPRQMPSGATGKFGYLRLGFRRAGHGPRSELHELDRRAPCLAQKALYWDTAMPHLPCVFTISTTGCLLQGDRSVTEVVVGEHACAHITSQSASKIHSMDANFAACLQDITVRAGGYCEFLPEPTIPHRHSRYLCATRIACAASASVLYGDILLSGRRWHHEQEHFGYDLCLTDVRVTRLESGQELCAERMISTPGMGTVHSVGVMGGFDVLVSLYCLTPPETAQRLARALDGVLPARDDTTCACGLCQLPHASGLALKALTRTSEQARELVRRFWGVARREITGYDLPPPFLWR